MSPAATHSDQLLLLRSLTHLIQLTAGNRPIGPVAPSALADLGRYASIQLEAAERGERPPVACFLDVSLAHISQASADLLAAGGGEYLCCGSHPHGYWLYADATTTFPDGTVPADLIAVITIASRLGCSWVKLDEDGHRLPSLPVHDWQPRPITERPAPPPCAEIRHKGTVIFSAPPEIAELFLAMVALTRALKHQLATPDAPLTDPWPSIRQPLADCAALLQRLGMTAPASEPMLTIATPAESPTPATPLPEFEVGVRGILQLTHTMKISAPDKAAAERQARAWLETDDARSALLAESPRADVDDLQIEFIDHTSAR